MIAPLTTSNGRPFAELLVATQSDDGGVQHPEAKMLEAQMSNEDPSPDVTRIGLRSVQHKRAFGCAHGQASAKHVDGLSPTRRCACWPAENRWFWQSFRHGWLTLSSPEQIEFISALSGP